MDLSVKEAPSDLMTKFVDVLARLPNLRTLELLHVTRRTPVTNGLKRKCAKFPSIREMTVCSTYPDFIRSCPNLESLSFRHGFGNGSSRALGLYGAGLKRVRGVVISRDSNVECELPKRLLIRGNHSMRLGCSCGAELSNASGDHTLWYPPRMSPLTLTMAGSDLYDIPQ